VHVFSNADVVIARVKGWVSVQSLCGSVWGPLDSLSQDGPERGQGQPDDCISCRRAMARQAQGPDYQRKCGRCGWRRWDVRHVCTAGGGRLATFDDSPDVIHYARPADLGVRARIDFSTVEIRCEHGDLDPVEILSVRLDGHEIRLGVCGHCLDRVTTCQDIRTASGIVIGG
jgi:hypothetical protein